MVIKITGWKGVASLIIIVLIAVYKYVAAFTSLDSDGKKVIENWITAEYQRYHLSRNDISDEIKAELLLKTKSLNIISMTSRGGVDSMAVRVEIEKNDAHPPSMSYVQYYKLEYTSVSGWHHSRNITA